MKKSIAVMLVLLCLLMISAVSAASDTNNTIASSDITDNTITHTDESGKQNTIDTLSETEKTVPNDEIIKEDNTKVSTKTTNDKEDTKTSEISENNNIQINTNQNTNILTSEEEETFTDLNNSLSIAEGSITLENNYKFNNNTDKLKKIIIDKNNFLFDGNNKTIDANYNNFPIIFINVENITIQNTIFKNGITFLIESVKNFTINNVTFENLGVIDIEYGDIDIINTIFKNTISKWGLIQSSFSNITITNTTFANSTSKYSTAIHGTNSKSYITNSTFINLNTNLTAGAIAFKGDGNGETYVTIEDCKFINVSSTKNGGAIFIDIIGPGGATGTIIINNTLFENCSSEFGGAYLQLGGELNIINSNFTNNYATYDGGAVYLSLVNPTIIENCIFSDNNIGIHEEYPTYGGAIFFDKGILDLSDSEFINNTAYQGSGVYIYDSAYNLDNLVFSGNSDPAIYTYFDDESSNIGTITGIILNPDDFNNMYYPGIIEGKGIKIVLINNTVPSEIPDYYDLRELNLVSPVRNQGNMGSCWAFGMTATLESALIKAINYTDPDFSENNMQNTMLIYSKYGDQTPEGGMNTNGMAYLLSWLGAFPANYDTYDELGKISPIIRTNNDVHIQDIIIIPNTPLNENNTDLTTLNNVKEAIMKYGALGAYLLAQSTASEEYKEYFNEATNAEYNPNHAISNHAVCLVGWNDTYSRYNFNPNNIPPGDGAWIIKNSWGTDWGDNGYFYVSYYDQTLCAFPDQMEECFVAIIINNTNNYNKNYEYDISGITAFTTESDAYLNIFESVGNDVIAAVGTYFNEAGVDYTVEIRVNDNLVYTQTGVSPYYGYHTITLDNYVPIKEGDIFSIMINSTATPYSAGSRVHFKEGTSFSYENNIWLDISQMGIVACLKAYTLPNMIKTEDLKIITGDELFIVEVNETNAQITISINNNTLSEVTDKDGIAKFKLPELDDGNYTITTTYNQTTIINTVQVNNLTRTINKQNQTINKQNQTINELNNTLTNTETELKETDNKNKELTTQKDDATKALAAKNAEATQLTVDKTNLQNQVNTLQGQVNTLKEQNTEASAKISKVKAASKVKKSKNFKITVTLSSTKVNGKYVYVIFNGKSYKAKVKNGVAKITIKKSALKKLGGKTVKYSVVYDQSLKNKSVKVKK